MADATLPSLPSDGPTLPPPWRQVQPTHSLAGQRSRTTGGCSTGPLGGGESFGSCWRARAVTPEVDGLRRPPARSQFCPDVRMTSVTLKLRHPALPRAQRAPYGEGDAWNPPNEPRAAVMTPQNGESGRLAPRCGSPVDSGSAPSSGSHLVPTWKRLKATAGNLGLRLVRARQAHDVRLTAERRQPKGQ